MPFQALKVTRAKLKIIYRRFFCSWTFFLTYLTRLNADPHHLLEHVNRIRAVRSYVPNGLEWLSTKPTPLVTLPLVTSTTKT